MWLDASQWEVPSISYRDGTAYARSSVTEDQGMAKKSVISRVTGWTAALVLPSSPRRQPSSLVRNSA